MTYSLQVKEANIRDAGRGIIRLNFKLMKWLKLQEGDILEIRNFETNHKTAAPVFGGNPAIIGIDMIQIDPLLRRNSATKINDFVGIRKIEAPLALQVSFAGFKKPVSLKNAIHLAKKLKNRIITKYDILSFNSGGEKVDLVVLNYTPDCEAVKIHEETALYCQKEKFNF